MAVWEAKNERGRNCALSGHFELICKKPKTGNKRGRGTMVNRTVMRRIDPIEQDSNQLEDGNDQDEDNIGLHVGGGGNRSFMNKGKIDNVPFATMIGSGSPITIFTQADLKKLIKKT